MTRRQRDGSQTPGAERAGAKGDRRDGRRSLRDRPVQFRYGALLEAAPDAMIIVDPGGRITAANGEAERLFGYARGELLGRQVDLLVPERFRERHPGHRAGFFTAPRTRAMGSGLELYALRKDGTEFPVEISLSPLETPEGPLATAAIRDISERKVQYERLREASRLKSEFLANMSHELRTPLNAVIGFAELMHDGKVGPVSANHKEFLGDILTSARHLLQLLNDVLDLSRIDAGRMEFRPEAVRLERVIEEVRDGLQSLAAQKRIRVECLPPEVSEVRIDPTRLKQVLYNYLSNALKFTPDGGRITVQALAEGPDAFRLEVEDTGIGIHPDDMRRLFVEFQPLDASTGKRYPGTGLGLALTKRIVEAQGGRTGVRSVPGQGSVFYATFPRNAGPAAHAARRPAGSAEGRMATPGAAQGFESLP